MNDSVCGQLKVLVIFLLTGFSIGILFDLFRAQRKAIKTPDFITYIQDILYWIISGIIITIVTITFTDGEVRSYMLIGLITGIVMYFALISKYVMKFFVTLASSITRFFSIIFSPIMKKSKKKLEKDL